MMNRCQYLRCLLYLLQVATSVNYSLAAFPGSPCKHIFLNVDNDIKTITTDGSDYSVEEDQRIYCWSIQTTTDSHQIKATFHFVENAPGEIQFDAVDLGSPLQDPLTPGTRKPGAMYAPFSRLGVFVSIPEHSNATFSSDIETLNVTDIPTCALSEHLCEHGASFCVDDDVSCHCLWNPACDCGVESHFSVCTAVILGSAGDFEIVEFGDVPWKRMDYVVPAVMVCWVVTCPYGRAIKANFTSSTGSFRLIAAQPDVVHSAKSILNTTAIPNNIVSFQSSVTFTLSLSDNQTADSSFRFSVESLNDHLMTCEADEYTCSGASFIACFDGSVRCIGQLPCTAVNSVDEDATLDACGPKIICLNSSTPYKLDYPWTLQPSADSLCTWWVYAAPDQFISIHFDRFEPYVTRPGVTLTIGAPDPTGEQGRTLKTYQTVQEARLVVNVSRAWVQLNGDSDTLLALTLTAEDPVNCDDEGDFSCYSGIQCINQSQSCDGFPDCVDKSDEIGCDPCSAGQLFCNFYTQCVPSHLICDGLFSCQSYYDELDCGYCGSSMVQLDPHAPVLLSSPITVPNSDHVSCLWLLQASPGYKILIRVLGFAINLNNNVAIGPGHTPNPYFVIVKRQRGVLPRVVVSDSHEAWIRFYVRKDSGPGKTNYFEFELTQFNHTVDCQDEEFQCSYGLQCVPFSARCDYIRDCDDYSDEMGCDNCPPSMFSCGDGSCIGSSYVCDLFSNCLNALDEFDCFSFCGASSINITRREEVSIRLDAPAYYPYFCGWRVTSELETFVYIDIVAMDHGNYQHMIFLSDVENLYAPTRVLLYSSDTIPGTTYYSRGSQAFVASAAFEGSTANTTVEIIIRVNNETELCGNNQTLLKDHNICLSSGATCDGRADFTDFTDEMSCDTCGIFNINASTDDPATLVGEFDVGLNSSKYEVYQGNTSMVAHAPTWDTDTLRRFDCVWRVTSPPATRIEILVQEFSTEDGGVILRLSDGEEAVGDSIVLELRLGDLIPTRVFFDGLNLWVTIDHQGFGMLDRVRIIFKAHITLDCSDEEFTCPTRTQCIDVDDYCDGILDCKDFGDELGCGNCADDEFECHPGAKCIYKYQLCDEYEDCSASNDQFMCSNCGNAIIALTTTSVYSVDHRGIRMACVWIFTSPPGTRIRVIFVRPSGCPLTFGDGSYSIYVNSTVGFRTVSTFVTLDPDTLNRRLAYPASVSSKGSPMWLTKSFCRYLFRIDGFWIELQAFRNTDCLDGYRLCPSGTKCVDPSAFCDGKVDCPEHGDEIGCGECGSDEYACLLLGNCTHINNICDGKADCADRSDEYNCEPCGETFFHLTDDHPVTISSVGWPGYSPDYIYCIYLIRGQSGHRITIEFLDFETDAGFDKLLLGNGVSIKEDVILELSGNVFPSSVTSKQHVMYIEFTTDNEFPTSRFSLYALQKLPEAVSCNEGETLCDYKDTICVNDNSKDVCPESKCNYDVFAIERDSVVFKSPNHPHLYPADLYCKWDVPSPRAYPFTSIDILAFSTEPNKDRLRLSGRNLLGETSTYVLTGSIKIRSILFNSTEIVARLATDSNVQDVGFHLLITNVDESNWCADEASEYMCKDGACLSALARCDGFNDCLHGDDEDNCESVFCPEFYMCMETKTCILWESVCDGKTDCNLGDDEQDCELKRCPSNCSCQYVGQDFHVLCNNGWGQELVKGIAGKTAALQLVGAKNQTTPLLQPGLFKDLPSLQSLSLPKNSFFKIPRGAFYGLSNLTYLNISGNNFFEILKDSFSELKKLEALVMTDVPDLSHIGEKAFTGLNNLKTLVLTRNTAANAFLNVEMGAFSALPSYTKTVVDDYKLCCNFLRDIPGFEISNCQTTQSRPPLNLCGSLMQNYGLRVCMWVLGLSALLGNLGVIVWRLQHSDGKEVKKIHSFLVLNLAISDFMMGVYMLIIAAADIHYGERYSNEAREWRGSAPCKIAGIISVLSGEASVFFVTLISIECFLCVVLPFSRVKLSQASARVVVLTAWVLILCLSAVPTLVVQSDSDVYGLSDVCIGLPLTTKAAGVQLEPSDIDNPFGDADALQIVSSTGQKPAWIFSIVLFLGINLCCFLVVLCCYVAIFVKVKLSVRKVKRSTHSDRDVKMAVKMALIVGTDFICWMPVIILGILSQTGLVQVGAEVYSWIVVLVLPVNSSLNPYLYTIYSVIADKRQDNKQSSQKPLMTNFKPKSKSIETVNTFLSDKNSN